MKIIVSPIEETSITKEQLLAFIKVAFQERKDAGLNYGCLSLSLDAFLEETRDSIILVAIDSITKLLCGSVILLLRKDRDGKLYGREKHTSVHPEFKGQGIGSILISALKEKAIEQKCEYIICSTAVEAKSAVMVHLKNGYHIIGMKSYKSTNYYSYLFRLQLAPSIWTDPNYCVRQYKKSARRVRIAYNADGTKTFVGRLLAKVGVKW